MHELVLKKFFEDSSSPDDLARDLEGAVVASGLDSTRHMIIDMDDTFEVLPEHLIKVCNAVINLEIEPYHLQVIGFCLIASDAFFWDTDSSSGAKVAETVQDWTSPEINYPLTLSNVSEWRNRLLGLESNLKTSDNLTTMDSFPLSWRFTDPKYNLLPPEDLNRIHPLNTIKRISLYNNALRYVNNFEFNKDEVKEIEYINLENGLTVSQIANWISDRITSNLLIIWNKETAVHTENDVFVKYFDDFLYPSSDDVIIIPQNSNWIMYYMHANILYYGRIKNK